MKFLTPLLTLLVAGSAIAEKAPDFSRDVRPILSQHCFKCHGPDDKSRKGGLRLDLRESALKEAKSGGIALVPGKPAESELVSRIFTHDEDELMPPSSAKRPLTDAQKDTLRRWVAAGAEYQEHWAFQRPVRPGVPARSELNAALEDWKKREPQTAPALSDEASALLEWPRNAIDSFVLRRLLEAHLAPSPSADVSTLCRRIHLDLVGILPTLEEQDAFAASANIDLESAVASLADRLLASPRYGERWARKWLDLARYADTNGYEKDRPRTIWPYRDWVVRALNADMPFDRFTIEQIAGDMLPGATVEQRIATGFHRNTMLNEEGGIDPNEFRFHAMTDRVATTGTTWLGLTTGCAQCHTHKFDPLTHREYFQLMAFLNNADEPDIEIRTADLASREEKNRALALKLRAGLEAKWKPSADSSHKIDDAFSQWLSAERSSATQWQILRPVTAVSNLPLLTIEPDGSIFASGDITKSDRYDLQFKGVPKGVTAMRIEALPDSRLPAHGPGMTFYEGPKGDFFIGEFLLISNGKDVFFSGATESYAKNNFGKNPAAAALMFDGDAQTGWTTAGRMGERHTAILTLPAPLAPSDDWKVSLLMGRHYACSIGRFRISVTTDPKPGAARDLSEAIETLLRIPDQNLSGEQRKSLREEFLMRQPALKTEAARIRDLEKHSEPQVSLGFQERAPENPRPTFMHHRGEFLQPTERVTPGVPAFLNPLPANSGRDRLAFAHWLVASENPLTARVTVNRQWGAFFGNGIVRTLDDFGYQGETPSHPELLDWLAVEFMNQSWSLKKLHRLIVTSATYRQTSHVTGSPPGADPNARLLSRFPRIRLEAEVIRDGALASASMLTENLGGPGVFPPQPEGATEAAYGKSEWKPSTGPDRYRRSLYTFSKRTAPFALYHTFDAPTGESCIARRDVSNTPLQALSLLNDITFNEAAIAFGKSLAADAKGDAARVEIAFRKIVCRHPEDDERSMLMRFIASRRGEKPGGNDEDRVWAALVRALFNLDETVTKG